jgi:sterol desaturase/sphingolipid hydroxylase (fatty acid hydroxylase superfamily)
VRFDFIDIVGVSIAVFLGFHFIHYVAHRWLVHRPFFRVSYEAHALGHHRVYTERRYESVAWIGFNTTLVADYCIGVSLFVLLGWLVPWEWLALITAEGLLLSGGIAYVHRALHLRGHWLKRVPLLSHYDQLHVEHHRNVQKNYGIFFHGFDRLFGTFVEPRPRSLESGSLATRD